MEEFISRLRYEGNICISGLTASGKTTHSHLLAGEFGLFVFAFSNIGHWYAKPTAIDIAVFCNFEPAFDLIELNYGSVQENKVTNIRSGVGAMQFLKAKGLKLTYGEEPEEIHVRAKTPKNDGEYMIRICAYSDNGVSLKKEFKIMCRHN